jgi:hypothetical protein
MNQFIPSQEASIGWQDCSAYLLYGFRLIDSMVRGIHASLRSR